MKAKMKTLLGRKKTYEWSVMGSVDPLTRPQFEVDADNRDEAREILRGFKQAGDRKAHILQKTTTQILKRVR